MRVTCERCLRRYDVPDATVKGRKIRARCKCGARVVVQDEERAARSSAGGGQTTGSIQRPVRWFVDITSWEPIAMDLRQLVRAFDGGRIDADTLVWRKGMPDWRRLRDVTELAERLMGTDANGKSPVQEPSMEPANAASEPPPRQPERSRTPPASYSVGEPDPNGEGDMRRSGEAVSGSGAAATSTQPGGAGAGAFPTRSLASIDARDRSEHNSLTPATLAAGGAQAFDSSSGGATPGGAASLSLGGGHVTASQGLPGQGDVRPIAPRTITQTGLAAPPAESAERASTAQNPDAKSLDVKSLDVRSLRAVDAEGAANNQSVDNQSVDNQSAANQSSGSLAAPTPSTTAGTTPRTREGRSSAPPGAARRKPSSDETPAQKPSSMSVPAGVLAEKLQRPRFRHVVAISGLVLVVGLLLRGAFSADTALSSPVLPAGEQRAGSAPASVEPQHIERSQTALEPFAEPSKPIAEIKAVAEVKPAAAVVEASAARSASIARPEPAAPTARAAGTPATAAPHGAAPLVAAAPVLQAAVPAASATAPRVASGPGAPRPGTASVPVLEVHPSAPAKPMGSAPSDGPLPNQNGRPAPAERTPTASAPPVSAPPPSVAPATPATPQKPTAEAPDPTRAPKLPSAPTAPGPFDRKLAQQQLDIAAFKASTCGQLGQTRGAGEVSVTVESRGRVVRVTHLNPGFIGTPVGLCVTQAFQQLQVPPFSGGPQSLTGSFVVQ